MRNVKKFVVAGVIVVVIVILAFLMTTSIPAGHTGVVTTFGRVEETVLSEGLHMKAPWQSVVMIDNRINKLEVHTEAFSKDLQSVDTLLAVNYRVDPSKSYSIYKNVGSGYEDVLIVPAVNEVLKAITATYTAEESVTNRVLISDGLLEGLNGKLNDIGLYVTDVNILDFDFSEAFISAIEDKQVAQQRLLKAETDKQTAITNAQADAESAKIRAEGEAEANKALENSLTDNIMRNTWIARWDGKLPQYLAGENSDMMFGILPENTTE